MLRRHGPSPSSPSWSRASAVNPNGRRSDVIPAPGARRPRAFLPLPPARLLVLGSPLEYRTLAFDRLSLAPRSNAAAPCDRLVARRSHSRALADCCRLQEAWRCPNRSAGRKASRSNRPTPGRRSRSHRSGRNPQSEHRRHHSFQVRRARVSSFPIRSVAAVVLASSF
jgi:hypothetical protein